MRVKKVICLECNTVLEVDYDVKNYVNTQSCDCPNETSLYNYFTISQPGSIVRAIDKTKVKAQLLYDTENVGKAGDWFYLIKPEDENTPKFTKWEGKTEDGGFTGGLIVDFETEPMTFNDCRTYLKTNVVMSSEGRIYSLFRGIS